MRAVRYHDYGSADVLQVDEVDRPTPDHDEVLVEMRAASVNRVDVMFRSGQYGELPLPSIPGGDGAGVVAAVGEDVEAFEPGDRVFASGMDRAEGGTFAEYAAIPAEKLARLPEDVSWTAGGAIGNVGATAWMALENLAGIQAGDRVLIHGGSGGVGHAAVQIAAHSGAEVITTAGSEEARARLQELGATVAFDYESDSLAEDILAATDGAGVDTVLDHRLEEYLDLDLSVVTDGGTVISTMGHIPETNGRPLYNKEVTIQPLKMDNHPTRRPVLERLARLMRQDVLAPVVADTYAFEDTARAHHEILAGGYVGKLVVTP
ncbi:Zn-dependent oxidoreductase [Halorubrum sp. Ib24]|uniref:quinone oxidoreductase family protein n=1 Tax=unclassified Halorubrum TaxID=2642239 RepID=UPI000B9857DB|nr:MULTISPECIES: NADPH:quinone reductase [unclassified Halorubrum]OYR40564.1 Zn-dependent oxidoreductase [Halorubrum sp. Ib24]OYR44122.1 Zn-dependent oxidoreductase [Halorubrum sp. Eb13]OYR55570.1 Zn-dependent oxidoreductase [Halorubrum sp. Ea1]